MFSFGEVFRDLWAEIPDIVSFQDYVAMANAIDDARTGSEITDRDEEVLLDALDIIRNARNIRDE